MLLAISECHSHPRHSICLQLNRIAYVHSLALRHSIISICEIPPPLAHSSPPSLCPLPSLSFTCPLPIPPSSSPCCPSQFPPPHCHLPNPAPLQTLSPCQPLFPSPSPRSTSFLSTLPGSLPAPQSRHATSIIEVLLIYSSKVTIETNNSSFIIW